MLANPPPFTQPQVDGLRYQHAFLDGSTLFIEQVSPILDALVLDALRATQQVLTATNNALAYLLQQGATSVHTLTYLLTQKRLVHELSVAVGLQTVQPGTGYTLSITQKAIGHLEQVLSWDPVLQTQPNFDVLSAVSAIYTGLTVVQGGQNPPYVQTNLDYLYRIEQYDTIPSIAQRMTGSAANVNALIQYNQLRYPYISDNPQDQYGTPLTSGTLATQVDTNVTQVSLPGANAQVMTSAVILYLQTTTSTGGVQYETVAVQSFDQSTSIATLETPIQYTYPPGATWIVFPDPQDVTSTVLQIGEVLHIPHALVQSASNQVSSNLDYLGTDIALTDGSVSFQSGDLSTVSGGANLTQALKNRFQTPVGSDPNHPGYGNKLIAHLGQVGQNHFSTLAKLLIKETAMQDPRIGDVSGESVTGRTANSLGIGMTVHTRNGDAAFYTEVSGG